jgi:hypothetical protein
VDPARSRLRIGRRFRGPPGIANGGFASGSLAALLGKMTARLGARPRIGTEYRMVAWLLGRDGRKLAAGSALLGPDGEVLAAARALWVTVARTAGGSG